MKKYKGGRITEGLLYSVYIITASRPHFEESWIHPCILMCMCSTLWLHQIIRPQHASDHMTVGNTEYMNMSTKWIEDLLPPCVFSINFDGVSRATEFTYQRLAILKRILTLLWLSVRAGSYRLTIMIIIN